MSEAQESGAVGIPPHVWEAFRVSPAEVAGAQRLGVEWDYGVRCGNVVISRAPSASFATWSAKLREGIHTQGVRVARPLRSTDGRHVISGFRASAFAEGEPATRADEMVAAAVRLADTLSRCEPPGWVQRIPSAPVEISEVFQLADHAAWADDPSPILTRVLHEDMDAAPHQVEALTRAAKIHSVCAGQQPSGRIQLGHADMFFTTIFSGSLPPLVTDIVPVARPESFTASLAIVDSLLHETVDVGIIDRWKHLPDLPLLVLRAALYRLYIHALHPYAQPQSGPRMCSVIDALVDVVERTC